MNRRIFNRWAAAFAIAAWSCSMASASPRADYEGNWRIPGDDPGSTYAVITLKRIGNEYRGSVKSFEVAPGEDPNPRCKGCPSDKRDQPIRGLEIIWGLMPEADALVGGYLLEPNEGKLFRCQMRLSPDGRTLKVKTYVGIPLIGDTEEWSREESTR